MLHAGLDLSRNRLDICLLSDQGELIEEFAAPSDLDGVRALARRVLDYGEPVRGVIESMTGARCSFGRRASIPRIATLTLAMDDVRLHLLRIGRRPLAQGARALAPSGQWPDQPDGAPGGEDVVPVPVGGG